MFSQIVLQHVVNQYNQILTSAQGEQFQSVQPKAQLWTCLL
ncbi:MAG: hypothetical protein U9Q66_00535 [Patescibacteria group bacterium]|nr:hypothetical protein [Patescibacteria group bacterium]